MTIPPGNRDQYPDASRCISCEAEWGRSHETAARNATADRHHSAIVAANIGCPVRAVPEWSLPARRAVLGHSMNRPRSGELRRFVAPRASSRIAPGSATGTQLDLVGELSPRSPNWRLLGPTVATDLNRLAIGNVCLNADHHEGPR